MTEKKIESSKYNFTLEKYLEHEGEVKINIITSGSFSCDINQQVEDYTSTYRFSFHNFEQKGVKNPLIFSPIKWEYRLKENSVDIKAKTNLEAYWKRYRDKNNRKENQAHFLVFERLFFKTSRGLEDYSLSHSFYLPFFISYGSSIQKGDIIKGIDWLLQPLSLPMNTFYKYIGTKFNRQIFEGWVTLDKQKLDHYLTLEKFRERAKYYHYSQDFEINSKIVIEIGVDTHILSSVSFELEIKGEDLLEKFTFKIRDNKGNMFNDEEPNKPNTMYIRGVPREIDGNR